ncbi:MAG: hypothetical protein WBM02_06800 [bacterium]
MKKALLALSMIAVFGLVANVALTETVYFPCWQHGWGLQTFFSVSNASPDPAENAVVTINLCDEAGSILATTTGTVAPGTCWLPDTEQTWYTAGDGIGFGHFIVNPMSEDCVYLWGCIYTNLTAAKAGMPGFTLVLPQNPYGGH